VQVVSCSLREERSDLVGLVVLGANDIPLSARRIASPPPLRRSLTKDVIRGEGRRAAVWRGKVDGTSPHRAAAAAGLDHEILEPAVRSAN